MNTRALLALALFSSASLTPLVAFAEPTDEERSAARALGKEAHEAADRKDWATAADRFARADAIFPAPTFALGHAQALTALGKLAGALALYTRIVRDKLPPNPPPAFVAAVETANKELVALKPRVPHVILQAPLVGPTKIEVMLDGARFPNAELGRHHPIDPGRHAISAYAPGFEPMNVVLTSVEGKLDVVVLDLQRRKAPPPMTTQPVSPVQRTLGIVNLALGGAGVALGGVMGGLAIAKHGDIAKSCPEGSCPFALQPTLQPQLDQYRSFAAISTAAFITGGVLAGTGLILFVTAPKARPSAGWVTPHIGPGYAGLSGSF